ncbi:MAG: hypothetical protein LBI53_00380 [Candidatus Peribacteria bacterium]|jgi:nitrate reductase gamma subunit|nr:hypothetical protein [Candidatus Peribacteria bacterium]
MKIMVKVGSIILWLIAVAGFIVAFIASKTYIVILSITAGVLCVFAIFLLVLRNASNPDVPVGQDSKS